MRLFRKVPQILLGLLISVLWVMVGIPIFINSMFILNLSMKYLVAFLFGLPLVTVVLVVLFIRRKLDYIIVSISFLIGTILVCILIPVLLDP